MNKKDKSVLKLTFLDGTGANYSVDLYSPTFLYKEDTDQFIVKSFSNRVTGILTIVNTLIFRASKIEDITLDSKKLELKDLKKGYVKL